MKLEQIVHEEVLPAFRDRMTPFELAFAGRNYSKDLDVYAARLRQAGFAGHGRVLDAGCGFGQWSLALAGMNDSVDAFDVSSTRADFVAAVAARAGLKNLTATQQYIEKLTYPDASFDAIFCYGVIFLTPWRESLAELIRVLKPGGRLYVNANGFGWYKFLWFTEHNKGPDYDPRRSAANALGNTIDYDRTGKTSGGDIIIDQNDLISRLRDARFTHIEVGEEGCLGATDLEAARAKAFFRGEYGGDLGVYEVIATKGKS